MQRINESTYIDDTLVTYGEYQLFIDEMREQGKYYQPDHWTSYQFPIGQAQEPIVGVRQADAVAFCEWWRQKNGDEWSFRLPSKEEADTFRAKSIGTKPLGYWLCDAYQFNWICPVYEDVSSLEHTLGRWYTFAKKRVRNLKLNRTFNSFFDQIVEQNFPIDIGRTQNIVEAIERVQLLNNTRTSSHEKEFRGELVGPLSGFDSDNEYSYSIERDRAAAINRAIIMRDEDSQSQRFRQRNLKRQLDRDYGISKILKRTQSHATALECAIAQVRIREQSRARARTTAAITAIDFAIDLTEILSISRTFARELTPDRDFALNIYVGISIIQERLAGRSPAFEGIRLVKERIR